MAQSNNNTKLPNTDFQGSYPWVQATITPGGHEVIYNNSPGEESWRLAHPFGTYSEISKDGKKVSLSADKHYQFTSNGHSETVEGARDSLTIGGSRVNNQKGVHRETGESETHGVYEHSLKSQGKTSFNYAKESSENASEDDHVGHHGPSSNYKYYDGNNITFTTGTKYDNIEGEYGIRMPKGNMDIQTDSGKTRIKTGDNQLYDSDKKIDLKAASDITITSDTTITLVVGQSKIIIKPNKISIIGGNEGVEILSDDGDIITLGKKTKIQGGGPVSPPTTFM